MSRFKLTTYIAIAFTLYLWLNHKKPTVVTVSPQPEQIQVEPLAAQALEPKQSEHKESQKLRDANIVSSVEKETSEKTDTAHAKQMIEFLHKDFDDAILSNNPLAVKQALEEMKKYKDISSAYYEHKARYSMTFPSQDKDDLQNSLKECLEKYPNSDNCHTYQVMSSSPSSSEQMNSAISNCLSTNPNNYSCQLAQAYQFSRQNKEDMAISVYKKVLNSNQLTDGIRMNTEWKLATALEAAHKYDEAADYYKELCSRQDDAACVRLSHLGR